MPPTSHPTAVCVLSGMVVVTPMSPVSPLIPPQAYAIYDV